MRTLIGLFFSCDWEMNFVLFYQSFALVKTSVFMPKNQVAEFRKSSLFGRVDKQWLRKLVPLLTLIFLSAALTLLSPYFLMMDNLFAIGLQMAVVAIMAIGEMMVIISAGIDLSVGSILALSGIVATEAMVHHIGVYPAILLGILVGGVGGWINGILIAKGNIPPFIATLGTMGIARGLALIITGGIPVFGLPKSFEFWGGGHVLGVVPVPLVVLTVLAILGHIVLQYTRFGRYTYAIGGNMEAARLSGIPVGRYLIAIYTLAGFLYGIAGIILASRLSTGQPTAGTGYELDVITACVVGGASLSGGEGKMLGAMIGALIMGIIRNGSNLLDISAFWQQVIMGSIIIAAVFADQYRKRSI